jgi:hypothetical protein
VRGETLGMNRNERTDQMITVNDEHGRPCCVATNPLHMCPKCQARLKANRTHSEMQAMSHDDLLLPPRLDFGPRPAANAAADREFTYAGVAEDSDALLCPTLNYGKPGSPRGGDIASYPVRGVKDPDTGEPLDQDSADARGDEQHDPGAVVERGPNAERPTGRAPQGGRTAPMPTPQYDLPMVHEDRTDGQRGKIMTTLPSGQRGSIYLADWIKGMTGLPSDYEGQDYRRSPTQDADENRRKFGNQGAATTNEEEDALTVPTIDWQDRVDEIRRTKR